jgi:hypothetical protein
MFNFPGRNYPKQESKGNVNRTIVAHTSRQMERVPLEYPYRLSVLPFRIRVAAGESLAEHHIDVLARSETSAHSLILPPEI